MRMRTSMRRLAVLALAVGLSGTMTFAAERPCKKPSCMTYLDGLHQELQSRPNDAGVLMRLARAYQAEGDNRQTLRYLDLYLNQKPSDTPVRLEAATLAMSFPDFPAAEKHLKAAMQSGGDTPALHRHLGLMYLKMDRPQDAINEYKAVLARTESDAEAHANIGLAYLKEDNLSQAITHLHRATELEPNSADRHNMLGLAYIQANRVRNAVECFNRALAIQPGSIVYNYNLGEAYRLLGMTEQSLTAFDNALQEHPNTADEWFNHGKVHFRLGLYESAVKTYRVALEKYNDPVSRAQVYLAIGYAYEALNDVPQARQYFQNFLTIMPQGNTSQNVRERMKALSNPKPVY